MGYGSAMDDLVHAEITVDAPPEQVWRTLTDPELIRRYMADAQVTTTWEEGSPIAWDGEWNGKAFRDTGTVLAVDEPRLLTVTHYSPLSGKPDTPENHHVVTYELTAGGDGTLLSVRQENNDSPEMAAESTRTWQAVLQGVKDVTEAAAAG